MHYGAPKQHDNSNYEMLKAIRYTKKKGNNSTRSGTRPNVKINF